MAFIAWPMRSDCGDGERGRKTECNREGVACVAGAKRGGGEGGRNPLSQKKRMLSQAKPGATLHQLLSTRLSTVCRGSKAWNTLSCLNHRGFFNCLQMVINWSEPKAISKVRATGTQRGFFKYYAQISQLSCTLTAPPHPPPLQLFSPVGAQVMRTQYPGYLG